MKNIDIIKKSNQRKINKITENFIKFKIYFKSLKIYNI